ncbi:hypothetical protein TNCV_1023751 [Trichonephila clavipes]|nr:hypothetical protein TNCV_1023751 [Trichonephila clavipes]
MQARLSLGSRVVTVRDAIRHGPTGPGPRDSLMVCVDSYSVPVWNGAWRFILPPSPMNLCGNPWVEEEKVDRSCLNRLGVVFKGLWGEGIKAWVRGKGQPDRVTNPEAICSGPNRICNPGMGPTSVVPARISSQSSRYSWRSPLPRASALIQRDFGCVLGVQQTKNSFHMLPKLIWCGSSGVQSGSTVEQP